MKAVIIARVSTEEQKEAGNSLPAQVARLESYCERKALKLSRNSALTKVPIKITEKNLIVSWTT